MVADEQMTKRYGEVELLAGGPTQRRVVSESGSTGNVDDFRLDFHDAMQFVVDSLRLSFPGHLASDKDNHEEMGWSVESPFSCFPTLICSAICLGCRRWNTSGQSPIVSLFNLEGELPSFTINTNSHKSPPPSFQHLKGLSTATFGFFLLIPTPRSARLALLRITALVQSIGLG